MQDSYDILISGGGLVGASLACALSGQGLRIGLVEAIPFGASGQPSYDDRAIALAQGTQRIFAAMKLWSALAAQATPIHQIHASDRGRFGFTRLDRSEEGVAALGYVVLARDLGAILHQRLTQLDDVEVLCPAQLTVAEAPDSLSQASAAAPAAQAMSLRILTEQGEQCVQTRLAVAADGTQSNLRESFKIPTRVWHYGQSAIIANLTPERPHANVAYERFTDSGPIALLPLSEQRCALVWTQPAHQVDAFMALDDSAFLARLQKYFGHRLGRLLRVGQRTAYPLSLVRARQSVATRLALIGNAAHTLHPIAGQGFNLGIRDVAALVDVVLQAHRAGEDIGSTVVLERYAAWRRGDHRRVIAFTDGLTRVFTNPLPPIALMRDVGMVALDLCPPAKRLFGRLTMGRVGKLPRLARGLGW